MAVLKLSWSVFLIRSYGAPNGAGRCPVAQCLGPHWRNSKITWANIVNAVLDFGTKSMMALSILNMVGAIKNTLAQQET